MKATSCILILASILVSCERERGSQTIDLETNDALSIRRGGHELVDISAYGNGTQIRVLNSRGEEIIVHTDHPSGGYSPIAIIRRAPDGSPIAIEIGPDGTAINRTENPYGSLPGDDGYEPKQQAEQGVGGQPATTPRVGD